MPIKPPPKCTTFSFLGDRAKDKGRGVVHRALFVLRFDLFTPDRITNYIALLQFRWRHRAGGSKKKKSESQKCHLLWLRLVVAITQQYSSSTAMRNVASFPLPPSFLHLESSLLGAWHETSLSRRTKLSCGPTTSTGASCHIIYFAFVTALT